MMQRNGGKLFEGGKRSHNWAKDSGFQKKVAKNFRYKHTKTSRRAANLRSAPGGSHPSYATGL